MTYLVSAEQQARIQASGTGTPYFSIYTPDRLLSCQVNDSGVVRSQRTIPYNNGAGTGFADIQPHYSVMVGTKPGLADVGEVRLRSVSGGPTSGVLTLAENNIVWEDDLHLTVLRVVDLWPIFSRFTAAGVFYKDWDILYTDQNKFAKPVCIAGPPQAQWMNGGSAVFAIDLSRSYPITPSATVASYSGQVWPSAGAQLALNPLTGSGTLTVTKGGAYYAKFVSTDSYGKSQERYVVFFAHDDTFRPLDIAVKGRVTNRWSSPGWSTSVTVYDNTKPRNGAQAVLWYAADDYVNLRDGANILAVGHVRTSKVELDEIKGINRTTIQISSVVNLMGRHRALNISLNGTKNPTRWYHYRSELTAGRAVHHLYAHHSTLLQIADVFNLTQDGRWAEHLDFEESNLYDQANSVMWQHGILARLSSNLAGQLFVEKEIQYLDDASRDKIPLLMALGREDRAGQMTYTRNEEKKAGIVNVSGFSWDGSTATPLISVAPGRSPEWLGTGIDNYERQILTNQELTDELSGRILGAANNDYPDVVAPLIGAYQGVLDVVPQYWVNLPNDGGDWTDDTRFVCREINIAYDSDKGAISTSAAFEMEASAFPGVPGDYPAPETIEDRPNWTPPPNLEQGCASDEYQGAMTLFGTSAYWRSFAADWQDIDGNLLAGLDTHGCIYEPWQADADTADQRNLVLLRIADNSLYITWDKGETWADIFPAHLDVPNPFSDFPAPTVEDLTLVQVVSDLYSTSIYLLVRWLNAAGEYRTAVLRAIDWGWEYATIFRGRAIRTAIDQGNGSLLWVTYYDEIANLLGVICYDITAEALTLRDVFTLGAATLAQISDGSRYATPVTPEGFIGYCAILGAMEQPQGLGTGVVNVIETSTAGESWVLLQEGWTDELRAGVYLKEPRLAGTMLFSFGDADNDGTVVDELTRYKVQAAGQILLSTDYGASYTADAPATPPNPWYDSVAPVWSQIDLICSVTSPAGITYALGGWVSSNGLQRGGLWLRTASGWQFVSFTDGGYAELKPIWLAVNSTYLLISFWADDNLYLRVYPTATMVGPVDHDFGGCTLSQLATHTYYLFPATVPDNAAVWFAAGRMAAIPGAAALAHIAAYDGASWSVVKDTWGESYCAALVIGPDNAGDRELFAARHPKETV